MHVLSRSLLRRGLRLHSFSGAAAAAAERHPFSVEDLVRLQRVSDPALSPDGKTVVFTVRETDMAANRGRKDLWSLDLATKGAQPRRLTSHPENDNAPEWSRDGRYVYFVSSRSGSAQVWRLAAARRRGRAGHEPAARRRHLPARAGRHAARADAGCFRRLRRPRLHQRASQAGRGSKTSGMRLRPHVRAPLGHLERRPHLAAVRTAAWRTAAPSSRCALTARSMPTCRPSRSATRANTRSRPTAARLVFEARIKGKSEPWSTNFDLYEVSVDGRRACAISRPTIRPGTPSPCSRRTAACWRGARCSVPASKPIAST